MNKIVNSGIFNQLSEKYLLSWLCQKKLGTRAHVFIGTKCSFRCIFCYGTTLRNHDFYDKQRILDYMDFIKNYGADEIEITGGEPTEYPYLDDIIDRARNNFKTIAIITNGYNHPEKYHADEILFSYHGYNKKSHESITGIKDSWNKINDAIAVCHDKNMKIRINVTICKKNYQGLLEQAYYLADNYPFIAAVNYLPMNSWDNAIAYNDNSVCYSAYAKKLSDAISIIEQKLPKTDIAIRYMPFCMVDNTIRKYIRTHAHHACDQNDWMQELDGSTIRKELLAKSRLENAVNSILQKRSMLYSKFIQCAKCAMRDLCDGFQSNQIEREMSSYDRRL